MKLTTSRALRSAFALSVAAGLFCSGVARAAVPSGATASLAALREAYVHAVKARDAAALEALFDTTLMPPDALAGFRRHVGTDLSHTISSVALKDPEPTLTAEYAQSNQYFPQPVVKTLNVTFVASKGQADGSQYYIGSSAGRFYFVTSAEKH